MTVTYLLKSIHTAERYARILEADIVRDRTAFEYHYAEIIEELDELIRIYEGYQEEKNRECFKKSIESYKLVKSLILYTYDVMSKKEGTL